VSTLATQIRDAAYDRLSNLSSFKSFRKTPIPTLSADMLPALGVFLMRETMNPDGDANTVNPRFLVDAVISFMVQDLASKPEVMEGSVDVMVDLIENTILSDSTFLDLRDAASNQPIIEGVSQVTRTYSFPKDGETYFMECRLQMNFQFRCFFEPVAPNLLTSIVYTINPSGSAPGSPGYVQPLEQDFPDLGGPMPQANDPFPFPPPWIP
jgi:hypothetical protein